jgi:hypothetical protein
MVKVMLFLVITLVGQDPEPQSAEAPSLEACQQRVEHLLKRYPA